MNDNSQALGWRDFSKCPLCEGVLLRKARAGLQEACNGDGQCPNVDPELQKRREAHDRRVQAKLHAKGLWPLPVDR